LDFFTILPAYSAFCFYFTGFLASSNRRRQTGSNFISKKFNGLNDDIEVSGVPFLAYLTFFPNHPNSTLQPSAKLCFHHSFLRADINKSMPRFVENDEGLPIRLDVGYVFSFPMSFSSMQCLNSTGFWQHAQAGAIGTTQTPGGAQFTTQPVHRNY